MSLFHCALAVIATCLLSCVSAGDAKDFPLVWVCLGITIAGVVAVMYIAYRRPAEMRLPGVCTMTAYETEETKSLYDRTRCEPTV